MKTTFNNGLLAAIQQAAEAEGCSLDKLSVLAENDPYRVNTPVRRDEAAWIADQLKVISGRRLHPRGIHYVLVSQGNVVKPNGQTYLNTEKDWVWLSESVLTAARWLGTVPFDQILDARNGAPVEIKPTDPSEVRIGANLDIELPEGDDFEPRVQVYSHIAPQPYTLIMAGEKTSLEDGLAPLCNEFGAGLYLPNGNMSDRMCWSMAQEINALGRPAVIFYFSDFDPSGFGMPAELARKMQAFQDLGILEQEVTLYAPCLTKAQCIQHGLPSTPLKASDPRAANWRAKMQWDQTEIDALATLHPIIFRRIARSAMAPFFDDTLKDRCDQALQVYAAEQNAKLHEILGEDRITEIRTSMQTKVGELREQIEDLQNQLAVPADELGLDPYVAPTPVLGGLPSGYPDPLLDPAEDWVEQTNTLRPRKLK